MSHLLIAAIPLAWLVPNHYLPWVSAWQEAPALALVGLACLANRQRVAVPLLWSFAVTTALLSVLAEWATGTIFFGGDAAVVGLYLASFAGAVGLGNSMVASDVDDKHLAALAWTLLACAIASFGIALVQWTQAFSLGIYAADLPPGGRPFANVAQPNLLCSVFFLGLCSAALLYELRRLQLSTLALLVCLLLAGMAMTGSRTGWAQVGAIVGIAAVARRRLGIRLRPVHLAFAVVTFVCAVVAWPLLNDALLLSGGRAVTEQLQGGIRGPYWLTMVDAIGDRFWWGYGWLQSGSAQVEIALQHPPIHRQFEFSHNLVIELFLWAGVPVGGAIILISATALCRQARVIRDPRSFWLMAGVGGLLVHAMLEYPLHYAFFLMPCGVMIGAASALSPVGRHLHVNRNLFRGGGAALLALLVVVTIDYFQAEENLRTLRMETARIGTSRVESPAPDLRVLNQLGSLLQAARIAITPGLSEDALERLRRVAWRYPYANSLSRYAEALALNGRPEEALSMVQRLCSIHSAKRCAEATLRVEASSVKTSAGAASAPES